MDATRAKFAFFASKLTISGFYPKPFTTRVRVCLTFASSEVLSACAASSFFASFALKPVNLIPLSGDWILDVRSCKIRMCRIIYTLRAWVVIRAVRALLCLLHFAVLLRCGGLLGPAPIGLPLTCGRLGWNNRRSALWLSSPFLIPPAPCFVGEEVPAPPPPPERPLPSFGGGSSLSQLESECASPSQIAKSRVPFSGLAFRFFTASSRRCRDKPFSFLSVQPCVCSQGESDRRRTFRRVGTWGKRVAHSNFPTFPSSTSVVMLRLLGFLPETRGPEGGFTIHHIAPLSCVRRLVVRARASRTSSDMLTHLTE